MGCWLVGDDVGGAWFVSAWVAAEVVGHDFVDMLGRGSATCICYILFSLMGYN